MELLPCPFCGTAEHLRASSENMQPDDLWWGYVECGGCEMQGPGDGWVSTKQEAEKVATAIWNNRHAPEGWQTVPVEPTDEMLGESRWARTMVYKQMLAAAPRPGGGDE